MTVVMLERLTLQDLIHDPMFEAFADYDMFESIPAHWLKEIAKAI